MTCNGCEEKVKGLLSQVQDVQKVSIDRTKAEADITMAKHVSIQALQEALKAYPQYQISESHVQMTMPATADMQEPWLKTYKPILLIFAYITGITLLIQFINPEFNPEQWMNHFMAGFFLVFSFFKLLDLQGFADSYTTYDIIAKRWKGWAYLYAFIELGLGLAYISGFDPVLTNSITFIVMSISLVGVLQSVLNKRKIRCACLGAVFNLPMSTITILEDALMIVMSGAMLFLLM